jgi:hypothetical protein
MPNPTAQTRFEASKAATLQATETFLAHNPLKTVEEIPQNEPARYRNDAISAVNTGDIAEAMQSLERAREAHTGIRVHTVDGVLIRDARKAKEPPVRRTEAFEIQYLNAIRASIDIAELEGKPGLKAELEGKAKTFMNNFASSAGNDDLASKEAQEKLSKALKEEINGVAEFLKANEIDDAHKKLNVAKDFQNFNDDHKNVVTLSSIKDNEGKSHTVVEAEVAFKELTDDQKKEYTNITGDGPKPDWYNVLPEWQQKLCKKYASKIAKGEHVIPTQLRQIAGMKNAFEKITAIENRKEGLGGELKVLHTSKHAGTLASFTEAGDEARQQIANQNAEQARSWIDPNKTLHCNTFNSPNNPKGEDGPIVSQTTKAMRYIKNGKETNTAFNVARKGPGANRLDDTKKTLEAIANSLPDTPDFKEIKSRLKPKGFFGKKFRTGKAEAEIKHLKEKGLMTMQRKKY